MSQRRYPQRDVKALYGRSAGRCNEPACREECIKPASDDDFAIIGDIAHIEGHSRGSARHNPGLKEVDCYDNWILLCANHHRLVDAQPTTYPVELLRRWKRDHEAWISRSTGASLGHGTLRPPDRPRSTLMVYRVGRNSVWERESGLFDDIDPSIVEAAANPTVAYIHALRSLQTHPAAEDALSKIEGIVDDEEFPSARVLPESWLSAMRIGSAKLTARLADLADRSVGEYVESILLPTLGPDGLIDVFTPFHVTRDAARVLYEARSARGEQMYDGLSYRSHLNPDEKLHAVWNTQTITDGSESAVERSDPALASALTRLGLELSGQPGASTH